MNKEEMVSAIKAHILKYNYVSFAELANKIPGFQGGEMIFFDDETNIVLWGGMTEIGAQALKALRADKEIEMVPADPLVYLIDGLVPSLPIAKSIRKYKKQHWMPATFKVRKAKKNIQ